jgi:hypothetical protein
MKEKKTGDMAQMLAKLEGIKFEPKDLIEHWILLTYDIPAGAEGNKARYEFMKATHRIGAVMHTRSVYLMPDSDEAQIAALNVTKAGQAYLWQTHAGTMEKQKELTDFYDKEINKRLADIKSRLTRIRKHYENGEDRPANRMVNKTGELLNEIVTAATLRSSAKILGKIVCMYRDLVNIRNGR